MSDRISALRQERGWSQTELAKRAGVTRQLVGALESGRNVPNVTAAIGLAKAAIDDGLDGPLSDGIAIEQERFVEVFRTDDARIGVASFLEHGPGKAIFTGR